ncbi:MAG: glycosyltransferase [Flavobacterium sp.]|nr:glycosyltransferase [Flavobacterium sp.]
MPLQGYEILYNKHPKLFTLSILQQLPKIATAIKNEHAWLNSIIDEHKIDIVISDNRYGLYSAKANCIFITHQLQIKAPLGIVEKLLQKVNYQYIKHYNACWVPDFENDNNIAGALSHPKHLPQVPVHYIGPLSRFDVTINQKNKYAFCIILSGPEPQRTVLENIILQQIKKQNITSKIVLVRGLPNALETPVVPENVTVFNHLSGNNLGNVFAQSQYLICRSGYTTVMELLALQKKAILIPTPGQTEQAYLAKKLEAQGWCFSVTQQAFHFTKAIKAAENFNYQLPQVSQSGLQNFITAFIENTIN